MTRLSRGAKFVDDGIGLLLNGAPLVTHLARGVGSGRPAAPVQLVHLGLGNFFRAHQAAYTDRAPDAAEWGYAAFGGRSSATADALRAQDGQYTLVTREPDRDAFDVVASVSAAHGADDHDAWLTYLASPAVAAVTLTVTEAGYARRPDGSTDPDRPEVRRDLDALRHDRMAPTATVAGRLVAGLAARRAADAGPIALVPCDNLPHNGALLGALVHGAAERLDPALAEWATASVSVVSTVVDRITPRTTAADVVAVRRATGVDDRSPVVTEPFHEWALAGAFPAGRPRWDSAGAAFVDDVTPFEQRKLWLLNGAHSLLAYAGSLRGHISVADAIADDACRTWVDEWWDTASRHLPQPAAVIDAHRAALVQRFANPRIAHRLAQIAADGSQKLPARVLPVLRAERAAQRDGAAATRPLAAWLCHLRGLGAPVVDVGAARYVPLASQPLPDAARAVLEALDPPLADDATVVATVIDQCDQLAGSAMR